MRRNRILYGLLLISSFSFLFFYGGRIPYMFFHVALLLPVVSILYTFTIYCRFKYSQDIDKRLITKGDRINFLFSVHNEDVLFYPYLKIIFYGSETIFARQFQTINVALAPFKKKTFSFEIECKYRGHYDLGVKAVEIEDFLGIFKLTYNVIQAKYITVYPKVIKLDRFSIKTDFASENYSLSNSKSEDTAIVSDMRKYVYGDTLKKIHWKLSAKTNQLMVKNFQSTSETSATLLLDLERTRFGSEENPIIEDKIIECVVSIIYYCLSNWIPINFMYYKDKIVDIEAKNPMDFDEIYRILTDLNFVEDLSVKDIIDVYVRDRTRRPNIMIFTSNIDYDLYNQLHKTKFSGYEISVIYVSPEDITGKKYPEADNILAHLPEIGIKAYKVNLNDDIKLVLER